MMTLGAQNGSQRPRRRWIATAVVLGVGAVLAVALLPSSRKAEAEAPTFQVQRGPLTISISVAGTIRAVEQETIASEVEGQTTLIYLIDEGTLVTNGQLLVELDASALQDNLVEQQIRVQNAEASFIQAREKLAVARNQAESDIALAELNHRFAQEDLTQYVEGQYKQTLMEADSKITLAEEELQLGSRKLEWSEKLLQADYLSQSERDADRLSFNRAKLDLDLARAAKKLLEDFTYKREVAKKESDVQQTRMALERAKLKASADIVQAEADLRAKEAEFGQQKGKEKKIQEQIAKTRMFAPRDGLVVYATSAQSAGWRGMTEPLEEGQTVRERQDLIYLPAADEMMAVVQIHEANLDKVRPGLPAVITTEALQDRSFLGRVSRIAPLPDAGSMWMNPDLKVYRTEIVIDGRQPDLRTGMSCRSDILIDQFDDAVYVPVQAVMRIDGKSTAYVRKGRDFAATPVTVGPDNNRMIQVLSGLEPGQTVLLTPPLQAGEKKEGEGPGEANGVDKGKLREALRLSREAPGGAIVGGGAPRSEAAAPDPAQREALRKRMESMTPEQRRELLERGGPRRSGGEGRPPPGGGR
jgi:HlyD family secretion protein